MKKQQQPRRRQQQRIDKINVVKKKKKKKNRSHFYDYKNDYMFHFFRRSIWYTKRNIPILSVEFKWHTHTIFV